MAPFDFLYELTKKIKKKLVRSQTNPLRRGKKKEFIFIHLNKTGGTSIAKRIGRPVITHLTTKEIIDLIGKEKWKKTYKFTVVRNPWDKVVSHYKFRVKKNETKLKEKNVPFKEWVKYTYGKEKNDYYYNKPKLFQPQTYWLKDYNEEIKLDKIIRFENLAEGYTEVAKAVGLNPELPHLNKTTKSDYHRFYDEETKQIIADWFREDIAFFGYSFEN